MCVGGGWGSCIAVSGASTLRDVNFVIRSGQLSGCCVTLNALLKFMEIKNAFGEKINASLSR